VIEHAAFVPGSYSTMLIIPHFSYGRIGVILFLQFPVSSSRCNGPNRPAFWSHRLLRTYPGYWLAMVLAALILTAVGGA
jgi:peptidoglycan/LPS O-acetylase OafA/YrhL